MKFQCVAVQLLVFTINIIGKLIQLINTLAVLCKQDLVRCHLVTRGFGIWRSYESVLVNEKKEKHLEMCRN